MIGDVGERQLGERQGGAVFGSCDGCLHDLGLVRGMMEEGAINEAHHAAEAREIVQRLTVTFECL